LQKNKTTTKNNNKKQTKNNNKSLTIPKWHIEDGQIIQWPKKKNKQ
jgi:hypothetical protein